MKKRLKLEGLKVFYRQEGKGEPLILLHGWGKSGEIFSRLQKLLAEKFTSLALDLPGFGKTPPPSQVWEIKDYARLVDNFCRKLGFDKFSVLGHSFGGRVAIQLAAAYPERIEKLILTGVPALRKKSLKRLGFLAAAKIAKLLFYLPPFFLFKNQFRKLLYCLAGERDYYQAKGIMKSILKKTIETSQLKDLAKIKASTLIIWGEADRVTPLFHGRKLNQKIRKSALKIVAGASHKLPYEKPKEFFRNILLFLRG